ncbi:hypothetical protein [Microbacterium sp. zg.Y909]|uniref:hypothetical protein n=1 Tax=Microbacterium sp. zg.Y909 TaxID=2969413 RepID=UPI00214C1A46|nr:hypothetical protein [Microbacterium sp. zg.Y909]MCR2825377.1 hypothetical protein [Microbacterium sp. zg.Y909]
MDPLLLAGTVFAAVSTVYAVIAYHRRPPKRRIEYTLQVVPLVPASARLEDVEVLVRGHAMRNPHLVTLRLDSNSRADIPATAFDSKKNLTFHIGRGALLLSTIPGGIKVGVTEGEGSDPTRFFVAPQLIKKRARGGAMFMSEGMPKVYVEEEVLTDIDVLSKDPSPAPSERWSTRWAYLGAVSGAVGAIVAFFAWLLAV